MVEDRDYVLDLRFADGDYGRFPMLAAEVAQRKPAAIIVTTISAAGAAQRASATIPIVMTGLIDPVGLALIAWPGRSPVPLSVQSLRDQRSVFRKPLAPRQACQSMHEAIVVAKHAPIFGCEAEAPVEFVGAGIAGQRIDHDGGHRRFGEAYLEC